MSSTISLEMGLTHAEFFRTLPAALGGRSYSIADSVITLEENDRLVMIKLAPESERRIALLRMPVTWVRLEFLNYRQTEVDAFMAHFQRHFQRGGG
jgi:hypothetical protein